MESLAIRVLGIPEVNLGEKPVLSGRQRAFALPVCLAVEWAMRSRESSMASWGLFTKPEGKNPRRASKM